MGFLDASAQLIAKKAENTEMSDVCEPLGQCETGARQCGAKARHQLESDVWKDAYRSRPTTLAILFRRAPLRSSDLSQAWKTPSHATCGFEA